MTNTYKENQKLFFGTMRSMKQKKNLTIKNIKDNRENVIREEEGIMERWREYFKDLLEGKDIIDVTNEKENKISTYS